MSQPQTERLYYEDSYLTDFSARIIAQRQYGEYPAVALDRSAFYPEGGGQPPDYGTLNGVDVFDVQAEDGLVWHRLKAPLTTTEVHGVIDWGRRFDHMQQHHGQHLLSAAFEHLYDMRTVSFHLGATAATIDLATPVVSHDQVAVVEDLVNQIIWENHSVLARFVSHEELATIRLRKPPSVSTAIRVVSVADFDHSACGGTHPSMTGAVGLLHIRRWERRSNEVRVEFLCGRRASGDLRWKNAALGRLAATLSVGADEVEATMVRLREAEERARKGLESARERLITYEAAALLAEAGVIGTRRVVRQVFVDRSLDEVRSLAKLITAQSGIALLGVCAEKNQLVFACPDAHVLDCGALIRTTLAPLGGRGGGQAALAQGGVSSPALLDQALDAAIAALRGEEAACSTRSGAA